MSSTRARPWTVGLVATLLASLVAVWVLSSVRPGFAGAFDAQGIRRASAGSATYFTPLPDPDVDMTFLPDLDGLPAWATGVSLSTNAAGLRADQELRPKIPGRRRVVVLGDSFVAGEALEWESTLVPQMRELVDCGSGEPLEVVAIGVGGWNAWSALSWLERTLHIVQPDVVVYLMCANDLDSGYGFVLGNVRSATFDGQQEFGRSHASSAGPSIVMRASTPVRGLVGSGLFPGSIDRYRRVWGKASRLARLLDQEVGGARFLICLTGAYPLAHGLDVAARGSTDGLTAESIVVAPPQFATNNLLPATCRVAHRRSRVPLRSRQPSSSTGSTRFLQSCASTVWTTSRRDRSSPGCSGSGHWLPKR